MIAHEARKNFIIAVNVKDRGALEEEVEEGQ